MIPFGTPVPLVYGIDRVPVTLVWYCAFKPMHSGIGGGALPDALVCSTTFEPKRKK